MTAHEQPHLAERASALVHWLRLKIKAQTLAVLSAGLVVALFSFSEVAQGLAANKVWFKVLAPGRYRVYVNVTIPELKQYREYHVDFRSYRKASDFFWKVAKGADFYPPRKKRFQEKPGAYSPW